jgi:hypothetical protein
MTSEFTVTYLDYSREKSAAKFVGPSPVQSGFDTWRSQMDAIEAALGNIVGGEIHKTVQANEVDIASNDAPTDAEAQREKKWLVTYRGNTSEKLFRMEIPTAMPTGHLLPASDEADLTETDMAAFVAAFEAFVRSPDNGTEAVTVVSIRFVGRNI